MTNVETVSPRGLDLQERVIEINRVAKVVKGGRRFSFTALVAVGDEEGVVGIGYGKAREVPLAIQKGVENARKNLIRVPKYGQTLTHKIIGRYGAGHVVLRPASPGTGVIAGGGVRAVLELGGVRDVLTKSIGTQNPINLVKATMDGLIRLRRPEEVAELRGLTCRQVLGVEKQERDAGRDAFRRCDPRRPRTRSGGGGGRRRAPPRPTAIATDSSRRPRRRPPAEAPSAEPRPRPSRADAPAEEALSAAAGGARPRRLRPPRLRPPPRRLRPPRRTSRECRDDQAGPLGQRREPEPESHPEGAWARSDRQAPSSARTRPQLQGQIRVVSHLVEVDDG